MLSKPISQVVLLTAHFLFMFGLPHVVHSQSPGEAVQESAAQERQAPPLDEFDRAMRQELSRFLTQSVPGDGPLVLTEEQVETLYENGFPAEQLRNAVWTYLFADQIDARLADLHEKMRSLRSECGLDLGSHFYLRLSQLEADDNWYQIAIVANPGTALNSIVNIERSVGNLEVAMRAQELLESRLCNQQAARDEQLAALNTRRERDLNRVFRVIAVLETIRDLRAVISLHPDVVGERPIPEAARCDDWELEFARAVPEHWGRAEMLTILDDGVRESLRETMCGGEQGVDRLRLNFERRIEALHAERVGAVETVYYDEYERVTDIANRLVELEMLNVVFRTPDYDVVSQIVRLEEQRSEGARALESSRARERLNQANLALAKQQAVVQLEVARINAGGVMAAAATQAQSVLESAEIGLRGVGINARAMVESSTIQADAARYVSETQADATRYAADTQAAAMRDAARTQASATRSAAWIGAGAQVLSSALGGPLANRVPIPGFEPE